MGNTPLPPDSHINHASSIQYWSSISPDVNGMLGGYPQISRIDLRSSANFLAKLRRLVPSMPQSGAMLPRGVDCGAGIGRVTDGFLSRVCAVVDVVEPVENFARVIRENPALHVADDNKGRVGDIFVTGLENWSPTASYDLIWNQWCLGHLTDAQVVDYLVRCRESLTDSGLIVVKENLSTNMEGDDIYDEVDSSVTRTDDKFRALFDKAGLHMIRSENQSGFPKELGLLPIRFYALRPAS